MQRNGAQRAAVSEQRPCDRSDASGNIDGSQAFTAFKCINTDPCQSRRQTDRLQALAAVESIAVDVPDRLRYGYFRQIMEGKKAPVCEGGHTAADLSGIGFEPQRIPGRGGICFRHFSGPGDDQVPGVFIETPGNIPAPGSGSIRGRH